VHYGNLIITTNEPGSSESEVAVILRVPRMHYTDLDTGNVTLTLTDEGVLGYIDFGQLGEYGQGVYGSGFRFPQGDQANHLFSGCLWLGVDSTYVADASYDYDWQVVSGIELAITHEGGMQVARATWNDANGSTPLGLKVHMTATAAPDPPDDDFVLVEFEIENVTGSTVDGLYAGLYMDWDPRNVNQNTGAYLPTKCLGYMRDPGHPESTCVGLAAIDPATPTSFSLIDNPTQIHPYSEVRDQDAFAFMSSGSVDTVTTGPSDWSMVMAGGPYTITPSESAHFAVVVVAGEGLTDLITNSDRARGLYASVVLDQDFPITSFKLGPVCPNPFDRVMSFTLCVPEHGGRVSILVFDVRGRLVERIIDGKATPGRHHLTWHGQDERGNQAAPGIYIIRLTAGGRTHIRKAVLLR
jgi:hypothetical protein